LRQAVLAGQKAAADVRCDDPVKQILRVLRDRHQRAVDAGIAKNDIDLAKAFYRACEIGACLGGIRNVGNGGPRPRRIEGRHKRRQRIRILVDRHDLAAACEHRPYRRLTDAPCPACDDAHLPIQIAHGFSSSYSLPLCREHAERRQLSLFNFLSRREAASWRR